MRLDEELRGDVPRGVQLILVCKLAPNSSCVAITSHAPKHHPLSPSPTAIPLDVTWLIYGPHCRRSYPVIPPLTWSLAGQDLSKRHGRALFH